VNFKLVQNQLGWWNLLLSQRCSNIILKDYFNRVLSGKLGYDFPEFLTWTTKFMKPSNPNFITKKNTNGLFL
jgi:hypothetical protein